MARPRKPTKLHTVEGTLRVGRHADRAGEPEILESLGDAPAEWTPVDVAVWDEVADLIPASVAKKCDRLIVELTVRLVIRLRRGALSGALAAQLRCCLACLGMTPADRSRVAADIKAPDDPSAIYFN